VDCNSKLFYCVGNKSLIFAIGKIRAILEHWNGTRQIKSNHAIAIDNDFDQARVASSAAG
jgi:hypothetical protein